jgi:hypothetical protein
MKDQFYTKEDVAKMCIEKTLQEIPETRDYLWVEPSAGNGSFFHNLPDGITKVGIDIDPQGEGILKEDYLKWAPPVGKNSVVFGNPPFGRQSSLAKAFIRKSCEYANVIAFILPKSFTKPSMFNVFPKRFHLLRSVNLEKNAFILNGIPYDVPCVFQIWNKMDEDRPISKKVTPEGFQYVKGEDTYDIAFRRVGARAGKCHKSDGTAYSIQSLYFIRLDVDVSVDDVIDCINEHVFPSNTVGPRSLSKTEANEVINEILKGLVSPA